MKKEQTTTRSDSTEQKELTANPGRYIIGWILLILLAYSLTATGCSKNSEAMDPLNGKKTESANRPHLLKATPDGVLTANHPIIRIS